MPRRRARAAHPHDPPRSGCVEITARVHGRLPDLRGIAGVRRIRVDGVLDGGSNVSELRLEVVGSPDEVLRGLGRATRLLRVRVQDVADEVLAPVAGGR